MDLHHGNSNGIMLTVPVLKAGQMSVWQNREQLCVYKLLQNPNNQCISNKIHSDHSTSN